MKVTLRLILIIIFINLNNCKERTNSTKTESPEMQVEIKKEKIVSKDSINESKNTHIPNYYEYYFVSAKSGLNYRKSPKGEILGKFPLNSRLKVLEKTEIVDQIKDGKQTLKGKWLGIEKEKDTVYVFDAFLSHNFTYSDLNIYRVKPFNREKNGQSTTAFLNLSDSYNINKSKNNQIFEDEDRKGILKDTIILNAQQRKQLLKTTNLLESDEIFIYELHTDSIHTYKVKDFQSIACLNIYFNEYSQNFKSESDFEFGLDLGQKYKGGYENFVYIGKENPFQTGKFKPIFWKKVENNEFPIKKKKSNKRETLSYSYNDLNFYLQKSSESYGSYHLAIINESNDSIIHEKYYHDSEGTYLRPLNIENKEPFDDCQWAGELFKNRPIIIYGFLGYSFGCQGISFLNKDEPPIQILCDNRH